jgi:hypothetical protein
MLEANVGLPVTIEDLPGKEEVAGLLESDAPVV